MKSITTHHVNGLNEAIKITALGEPGPGGAHYLYRVELKPAGTRLPDETGINPDITIRFQNKPIASPADYNGLTNEAMLAVIIDRMAGFATGPVACSQNTDALCHLQMAMKALQDRTLDRIERGVEGRNEK